MKNTHTAHSVKENHSIDWEMPESGSRGGSRRPVHQE